MSGDLEDLQRAKLIAEKRKLELEIGQLENGLLARPAFWASFGRGLSRLCSKWLCVSFSRKRSLAGVVNTAALSSITILASLPAVAQSRSFGPEAPLPHSSLSGVYRSITFEFTGPDVAAVELDHAASLVGGSFEVPFLNGTMRASAAYGTRDGRATGESPNLTLLDTELFAWAGVDVAPAAATQLMVHLPLMFNYRRIGVEQDAVARESAGMFRVGVGAGLALRQRVSDPVTITIRTAPMLNMTVNGLQREQFVPETRVIMEVDVQLHIERVLGGRSGITFGGGFRYQTWALAVADFFPASSAGWFSYESYEPQVRIGVHW